MSAARRNWRGEKLLSAKELSKRPDLPLDRGAWTWGQWLKYGVRIDGVIRVIPTLEVSGRLYTSVEAVLEAIGDATDSQMPINRRKR